MLDRNSAVPLLSPEDESSRTDRSDHGKYTKWVSLQPQVSFRKLAYILLGITGILLLIGAIIGSMVGVKKYRNVAFPHRAVHASLAQSKDGTDIVESYFQPSSSGSNQDVRLIMNVWFREGTVPRPAPGEDNSTVFYYAEWEAGRKWMYGGQGFNLSERAQDNQWESIWTGELSDVSSLEAYHTENVRLVLPGRIVHSLVTNQASELVATFTLIPSQHDATAAEYNHTSTRPVSTYGPSGSWPLPLLPSPDTLPSDLKSFLIHSSSGHSMKTQIMDWASHSIERDQDGFVTGFPPLITLLSATADITIAKDYARYGLKSFEDAMSALKKFKEMCSSDRNENDECQRAFDRDGHFENLLEIKRPGEATTWKYGPFFVSNPGAMSKNYVRLGNQTRMLTQKPGEISDLALDWKVTYRSMTPAALSITDYAKIPTFWSLNNEDHGRYAEMRDKQELYGALLGVSLAQSRPIARSIFGLLARGLRYLAIPLTLHYWATRSTRKGIAIWAMTTLTLVNLICYIVILWCDRWDRSFSFAAMVIVIYSIVLAKQTYLCVLPEFRIAWVALSPNSDVRVPVPAAVRFRHPSASESKSSQQDARFYWVIRVIIALVTFAILEFAPKPPAIVAAEKYSDVMHGFGGATHWDSSLLKMLHITSAFQSSVWFVAQLSQLHLNHCQRTFAGDYAVSTWMIFASQVLTHIPQIFIQWFGRPQLMQPFTMWDVITLIVMATTAIQALRLPEVEQVIVDPVA